MEERKEYKHKACPFRSNHFCPNCELLIPGIDKCIFYCMNSNLGLLAKLVEGDKEVVKKIKDEINTKSK